MLRTALILFTFNVVRRSLASYCGQAAIPFTFQVLHSGLPVLGCARPKCFGWNANGTRAGETAQFYRIDGKEDGYLRRSDQLLRSPFRNPNMTPRVAKCEEKFTSQGCAPGQWLGGIAPKGLIQGATGLQVRCCWYAPLLDSEDRGVAMVTNGQLVVGGEVLDGGDLDGFDYIADIKEETSKEGKTVYAVSIRRMECKDEDDESALEPQVSQNAVIQNLDGDVRPNTRRIDINPPAPNRAVMDTVYAAVPPKASSPYVLQQQLPNYGVAAAPAPRYIPPQGQAASGVANGYQLQTLNSLPVAQQPIVQPQQYVSVQSPQAPGMQSVVVPTYPQYNHAPAPAQPAQPLGGLFNPVANPIIPAPQQLSMVLQQQQQQQPNTIPMAVPQQPQQQLQPQYVVQPISTTPLPTIPPLTFPTLDQIPKIDIPSVEDVENVIPPVQKAILTTVAKFFGVL
ncbi:hypothetical protein Y032_0015g2788 [Ancylostoma ceylanicum]|uniref:Uncharacterized protein n=1 Tax=Ancylostoma ceylanicum TaxID=53326 RepID=A0A016V8T3_9BILA|nr:hypothetical protein Y032_0015g2788 [Ancylostoma ceylanicum]